MDKSAIVQIQETATSKALNEYVRTDVPTMFAPKDFALHNLDKFQHFLSRFTGSFQTNNIYDFVKYAEKYCKVYEGEGNDVQVFINDEAMSAKTVFDIGTTTAPLHQEHTSRLTLKKTSAFIAANDIVEHKLSQLGLSDFLEDWSNCIQVLDENGEPLSLNVAITGVRKISIERAREMQSEVGDFSNSASVSERVEAKERQAMPATILFTCNPYSGLKERQLILRVALLTSRDTPTFALRIIGLEELKESLVDEFRQLLEKELQPLSLDIFRGSF